MKPSRKALLLDRDGVINVNHGYVHHPENCDFIPGIFALCAAAQKQGYRIIIVTNQSGIARRYYSRAQFHAFSRWIEHAFLPAASPYNKHFIARTTLKNQVRSAFNAAAESRAPV